ncbi:hypothetical protein Lal_00031330 [Lupinus albus]|nr:hypothetical protein Lal_00031330 [Lupinus albus]
MSVDEMDGSSEWSWEQDKAFESALVTHPEDAPDRWEKIAADVPGKTVEEIKQHYELLLEDINQIESGRVPLPSYNSSSEGSASQASDEGADKKGGHRNGESNHGTKASRSDQERRKGIAWTEDEHRQTIALPIDIIIKVPSQIQFPKRGVAQRIFKPHPEERSMRCETCFPTITFHKHGTSLCVQRDSLSAMDASGDPFMSHIMSFASCKILSFVLLSLSLPFRIVELLFYIYVYLYIAIVGINKVSNLRGGDIGHVKDHQGTRLNWCHAYNIRFSSVYMKCTNVVPIPNSEVALLEPVGGPITRLDRRRFPIRPPRAGGEGKGDRECNRLFLLGLEKYGKGDWRSISRNFVVTRTPTQVASHAQKYFIRLNSMNKDRRRSSIHDITSVNNGDVSAPQAPITGQTNGPPGNSTCKSGKQAPPASTGVPSIGIYAAPTIGQPIGGPLVSAVGTPVNLPAPGHMAYGIRAPVPGAPTNIVPIRYPMPHTSAPHSEKSSIKI